MDVEPIITAIRNAIAADAMTEARATGATACRAVLAVLEPPVQPNASPVQLNASAVASAIGALRGMAPEQLLDLAIAKLRAALPAGAEVAPVAPLKFHIIPMPTLAGSR